MKWWYLTEYNYFDNDYWVSAKMLDTFMNWDGTEQNYGSNDLIYKKVMNTSIYKRQVNLAINNLKSLDVTIINSYYKPWSQSLWSGLEDLNLAIWKANRKVSGFVNEKWQIETTFSVEDRYDFDKWNYLNPLTGTLNAMWLRYQERINWKPYYWNLTIKEVH
jgi:hypothetical protein